MARFLPGFRSAVFYTGGALKTKFTKFFLYDSIAALISVPTLILASYFAGGYIDEVLKVAKGVQTVLILAGILLAVYIGIKVRRWLHSRRAQGIE